jgi:hypothetical protein
MHFDPFSTAQTKLMGSGHQKPANFIQLPRVNVQCFRASMFVSSIPAKKGATMDQRRTSFREPMWIPQSKPNHPFGFVEYSRIPR